MVESGLMDGVNMFVVKLLTKHNNITTKEIIEDMHSLYGSTKILFIISRLDH